MGGESDPIAPGQSSAREPELPVPVLDSPRIRVWPKAGLVWGVMALLALSTVLVMSTVFVSAPGETATAASAGAAVTAAVAVFLVGRHRRLRWRLFAAIGCALVGVGVAAALAGRSLPVSVTVTTVVIPLVGFLLLRRFTADIRKPLLDPASPHRSTITMGRRRDGFGVQLVAVIAAHNEEGSIGAALQSLLDQTRRPNQIIVVADRCSDRTIEIAIEYGAEVLQSIDNRHRKAGALNQALAVILPKLDADDVVLMMDADTVLTPGFLAAGKRRLRAHDEDHGGIGAVGAVFLADRPARGVEALQRNEYLRYAHDLKRRKGRSEVISGTAGMFRASVLRQVAAERGHLLPAAEYVYDETALTEDNELTMAIKHLEYRCASPPECTVLTELMPTVRTLYHQRVRWQRGALDNLRRYGATRITAAYLIRQVLIHTGIAFMPFFIAVIVIATLQTGKFPWSWPWFFISLILVVERVWTVRRGGARSLIMAALVLPEILYDMFIHIVFIRAGLDVLTNARAHWDRAEAVQHKQSSMLARTVRIAIQVSFPVLIVVGAVALAVLCSALGIQWIVVGVIVGTGIAHSALRTTMLDPFGPIFGSGNNLPDTDAVTTKQEETLNNQVTVEQAKGMIAERGQVTATEAFSLLRSYAGSTRRGLVEVAQQVIEGADTTAILQSDPTRQYAPQPAMATQTLQTDLDDRMTIEQATGLLNERRGINMNEARRLLHSYARRTRQLPVNVSQKLIDHADTTALFRSHATRNNSPKSLRANQRLQTDLQTTLTTEQARLTVLNADRPLTDPEH